SSDRFNYGFAPFRRMLPIWTGEALHHLKKKK
ncbi:RNA-binding protein, partial [Streptococcus pneumoniae]